MDELWGDELSRAMTVFLRHKAYRRGAAVRPDGFMPLQDLLEYFQVTERNVAAVVRMGAHSRGGGRFEVFDDAGTTWIRATQKHSMAGIDPALVARPAPLCFAAETNTPAESEPGAGSDGMPAEALPRRSWDEALSKRMTALLRHQGQERGLPMRPDGFVPLSCLLTELGVFQERVLQVVARSRDADGVPRFETYELDGVIWIRATRNHSMDVIDPRSVILAGWHCFLAMPPTPS
jgi:RNA:NAD 2'-phosphotransferase (TPT1/KptA family)